MEASCWERLTEGEIGSVLMSKAMLSKSLINFLLMGGAVVPPPPVVYLGPDYGEGNEDTGDLLQKVPCKPCFTKCP